MADPKKEASTVLKYPVTVDGTEISAVTMRRPRVKDIAAIEKATKESGEMQGAIVAVAALTGLSETVVNEIDAEDFVTLTEKLESFLPNMTPAVGAVKPPT